ncbi:MAG: hypothetical protein V1493_02430 [Candidatus Diapherotrites archaeon]
MIVLKHSVLLALFAFSFIAMALQVEATQYGPILERSYCQNGDIVKVFKNPNQTTFTITQDCGMCYACKQQNWNHAACEPVQKQANGTPPVQSITTQKNERWFFSRKYCMNGQLFTEYKSNLGHYNSINFKCTSKETCKQVSATDAKCAPKPEEAQPRTSVSRTSTKRQTTTSNTAFSSTPLDLSGGRKWFFSRKYCLPSDTTAFYSEYKSNKGETNVQRFPCGAGYHCDNLPSGEIGCIRNTRN